MAEKIKGITVEIGGNTSPLAKALGEINDRSKNLQKELNSVNKLLKLDPSNTELLSQKQQILADVIEDAKKKVDAFRQVSEQANKKLAAGDITAEQYRELQRQLISAEQNLKKLEKQSEETSTAIKGLGNNTKESADNMKKAEDSLDTYNNKLTDIKNTAVTVGKTVTATAAGLVAAAVAVTESTEEYRRDFARLEQNAKTAGASIQDVTEELKALEALTNETDSSIEGLSNLLKTGFTGESLTQIVDQLSGAVIQFPDTLKIESLADSLQETLATAKATGQFGELLERLGLNLDIFNAGLEKCTNQTEKNQYALSILASTGLAEVNSEFEKNNKTLIESSNAQFEMRQTMANIANQVAPSLARATSALSEKIEEVADGTLPKLVDGFEWLLDNSDVIIAGLVGISAATLTNKAVIAVTDVVNAYKTLKSATNAATTSQLALNAAQSANPIGLVAGLIAGVTGGIIAYSIATKTATDETNELINSSKDLRESLKNIETEYKANVDSIDSESKSAQLLADSLYDLASKANKTTEEKKQMLTLVNQLNDIIPDLNLGIEEETGLLNLQKDEVADVIEKYRELYLLKANQESIQKSASGYVEAQDSLDKLKEQRKELEQEQAEYEEKLNKIQSKSFIEKFFSISDGRNINILNLSIQDVEFRMKKLDAEISNAATATEEALETYNDKIKKLGEFSQETTDASKQAVEDLKSVTDKANELTDEYLKNYDKSLENETKKYKKTLESSIDVIEDNYDTRINLLKKQQKEEERQFKKAQKAETEALEESTNAQLAIAEKAYNKKLELIDKEYAEKMKLVDEEKYRQLKAIQAEIDQLNAQTDAEDQTAKLKEEATKKAELEAKILSAETADEKLDAIKELAEFEEEMARERLREERDLQINILEEQKDTIEDSYDAKVKALEDEQKAVEDQAQKEYETRKKTINDTAEIAKAELEEKQYWDNEYFQEKQEQHLSALTTEKENAVQKAKELNDELLQKHSDLQDKKLDLVKQYFEDETSLVDKYSALSTYDPSKYIQNWNSTLTAYQSQQNPFDYDRLSDSIIQGVKKAGISMVVDGEKVGVLAGKQFDKILLYN